jgi:hypothetical protein
MPEIFTQDQVDSINGYQVCGMWHPFTCGHNHDGERVLVATLTGMKCPTCDYTQDWAHGFMADWSWKKKVEESPFHKALLEHNQKIINDRHTNPRGIRGQ